jgi:uncharacterized protein YodC (DUF2158 family)
MSNKFKVGDVVQLISGGPKMTVDSVAPPHVYAVWFSGARRESSRFHEDSIEMAKPDPAKK